jgi:hypothetical protein
MSIGRLSGSPRCFSGRPFRNLSASNVIEGNLPIGLVSFAENNRTRVQHAWHIEPGPVKIVFRNVGTNQNQVRILVRIGRRRERHPRHTRHQSHVGLGGAQDSISFFESQWCAAVRAGFEHVEACVPNFLIASEPLRYLNERFSAGQIADPDFDDAAKFMTLH